MSAALPRGAPASTQRATMAISSSLSEGSCLNFWMPMFFSTKNGGIAPRWLRSAVRALIDLAHGLTSS